MTWNDDLPDGRDTINLSTIYLLTVYITTMWHITRTVSNIHNDVKNNCKGFQNNLVNSYSASRDSWCTGTLWNWVMTAQCEGMEEVGSARYDKVRALCYSNCQRSTQSHQQSKG